MRNHGTKPREIADQVYRVPLLSNALDILEYLRSSDVGHTLTEVASGCGVSRSTAFRVLKTFVARGYVQQDESRRYHNTQKQENARILYLLPAANACFPKDVAGQLASSARFLNIRLDLICADPGPWAGQLPSILKQRRADLVIEHNLPETQASYIRAHLAKRNIPLICIDRCLPGTSFVGADAYELGCEATRRVLESVRVRERAARVLLLCHEGDSIGREALAGAMQMLFNNEVACDSKVIPRDWLDGSATEQVKSWAAQPKQPLIAFDPDPELRNAIDEARTSCKRSRAVAVMTLRRCSLEKLPAFTPNEIVWLPSAQQYADTLLDASSRLLLRKETCVHRVIERNDISLGETKPSNAAGLAEDVSQTALETAGAGLFL